MTNEINSHDGTVLRSDYYVYLFRDPRDNEIFYIGKGTGSRAEQFMGRNPDTTAKIEEIRSTGREPQIELLRDELDEPTAIKFEGVAIDVLGIESLTNRNHGEGTIKYRRRRGIKKPTFNNMDAEELKIHIDPDEAHITERVILIRINQLYRSGMDTDSLYDATRGVWVIGPRREFAKYAFSVFKGIVKEVYEIKKWYPAGIQATFYKTRPDCNEFWTSDPQRWEFEGKIAESDIREKYLNKSVKRYLTANSQNPIKYVNC